MDYRKFLGKRTEEVLPYLGGVTVRTKERRLRVRHTVPEGWWRFGVEGRFATAEEPADPPELSGRPRVRGHLLGIWLFRSGRDVERVHLLPGDEPPPLSTATAVRWWDDSLLFAALEFDTEVEELARCALEEGRTLIEQKGVMPSLRAAHGYALVEKVASRRRVPVSPFEARHRLADVSDVGIAEAEALVTAIDSRRQAELPRHEAARGARLVQRGAVVPRSRRAATAQNAVERAEATLEAAGAQLLSTRRLSNGELEVAFRCLGDRFVAVVDEISFQVYDAGICLSGADREVNLDSLPSVIREAIDTDVLVVTRR
jgi:hypothetical protein